DGRRVPRGRRAGTQLEEHDGVLDLRQRRLLERERDQGLGSGRGRVWLERDLADHRHRVRRRGAQRHGQEERSEAARPAGGPEPHRAPPSPAAAWPSSWACSAAHRYSRGVTPLRWMAAAVSRPDRKSTRLNSSHVKISYAVFCLKKKKKI